MSPNVNRRSRRSGAFTLAELLVAAAASVFLASIIYTAGSEMLLSFARNISINRSYSDARITLERIAQTMESAGHTPVLINADGLTLATTTPAAGIRFYRMNPKPSFIIASGTTAGNTLPITVPTGMGAPAVGDLMTIPLLGFQGLVTAVSSSGSSATLTFGSTIAAGCVPALTSTTNFATTTCSCLQYTQVAFVVVGTQLRYYPRAATTTAAFNTASNYKVIANVVASPTNANQLLPFSLGPAPTISITLCAEGPDYNHVSNIHTANTFTQMQTSLGPRNPILLRGPF